MQFLAELKTGLPFITLLPPSLLPLSNSARRPLTTDMCEECVRSPSSLPPSLPPLAVSHPSLTSVSFERSSHTLSLFPCFPLTLPLRPFFSSCLWVVSCDQSGSDESFWDVVTRPHPSVSGGEAGAGPRALCLFLTDNNAAPPT